MIARRDGMWLGAGDLAAEQRERIVRRRLHDALVHGAGTVWGLGASACEPDEIRLRTRIIVRPGLAVDVLDREIYVDREQCLDVAGLVRHPIWAEMRSPDGAASRTARRAYIVLRYEAPASTVLTPRPAGSRPGPWSEIDGAACFRLELSAVPPPEPRTHRHARLDGLAGTASGQVPGTPALALALQDGGAGAPWPPPVQDQESVPLLLATVDLDLTGNGSALAAYVLPSSVAKPNPDNRVRAVLPGTRRVAEALFGERLPSRRPPASRRGVVGAGQPR